jgi:VIT1/CCC1 family predicted Fe2+/Mn2+ transporter
VSEASAPAVASAAEAPESARGRGSWLRDLILGGQDGLVNVLGIVLGVSAASEDVKVLLAAGLAATFAEGVSMGAVAWTSSGAQADHYESERERRLVQLRTHPEESRRDLERIYAGKGFRGDLLERIVATIAGDEAIALRTLMNEDLGLEPADDASVRRSALIVGAATIAGSLIPLVPFFLMPRIASIWSSIGLSAVTLFFVGAYEAKTSIGDWRTKGLQMTLIGLGAAAVGYLAGKMFGAAG